MNRTPFGFVPLAVLCFVLLGGTWARPPQPAQPDNLADTSRQLARFESTPDPQPVHPGAVETGILKGTATYRERMTLPHDAVFEATLIDVSNPGAPARTIARMRIRHPGSSPISFEIRYDPSRVKPRHRYAVQARILVDGKILFTTARRYRLSAMAQSQEIALLLRRAGTSSPAGGRPSTSASQPPTGPTPDSALEATYWKLTRLGDTRVSVSPPRREPHLVLDPASHRVSGWSGCNRLMGSYELHGDQIRFTQIVGTMMACVEGMATEKAFLDVLQQTGKWKITGQQLGLLDSSGSQLASFEARR